MSDNGKQIQVVDGEPIQALAQMREPTMVLEEAHRAARALQGVIAQEKRPIILNGKQYLAYEHWQTLGRFYGLMAKTNQAEPVEIDGAKGARASAEVVDVKTGQVIGSAGAYCMRDEPNWRAKPWFQLASMAQTRAGAKAMRNVLSWVAVLAGYCPTPAEEVVPEEGGAAVTGEGKELLATLQVAPATPKVAPVTTGEMMVDTITDVKQSNGESNRGKWTRFQITTAGGARLVTFDKKCGDVAMSAMKLGKAASMQFKRPSNPKFGLELVAIDFRGDAPDTDAIEPPFQDMGVVE